MARQPWVTQIRNAMNSAEQIAILRALKTELIGHPLKKEAVVAQGVLDPIVRLSFNNKSSRHDGKLHDHSFAARPLNEEETVRLQGLHVISSIALGEKEIRFPGCWTRLTLYTRRPFFSFLSTIILFLTSDPFESLSIEQPLTTSFGVIASPIKSCRFYRLSIQYTFFHHNNYRRRAILSTVYQLLVPNSVSDLASIVSTMPDIDHGFVDQSDLSRRTVPAGPCDFRRPRCSCYEVGKFRCG